MVKVTLETPYTRMERFFPNKELAEKWAYETITITVPNCNQWKDCRLFIEGKVYPTTLQEVVKFRK